MAKRHAKRGRERSGKGTTLTPLQRRFVEAFVGAARGNATEAARQAGYKGNDVTLAAVGSENLRKPLVKAAVEERQAAASKAADWALADSLSFLTGCINTYMHDVVIWDGEEGTCKVKSLDDIPPAVRPYISSVEQHVTQSGETYLRVSLPDKLPYLRELNKLLGLHAPKSTTINVSAKRRQEAAGPRSLSDAEHNALAEDYLGVRVHIEEGGAEGDD